MNTAVINIRTELKVKNEAKKIASDLGLSLSTAINLFLKQFVRNKGLSVSLEEKPNAYLRGVLRQAKKDIKAGRVSASFDNAEDAIGYLDDMIKEDEKERN
ncbi:type II toxin-antitoxin system RelB/DinJ family antitoxin [Patescibacteria group bacterium]|nr:type II toxin-antitoxin system RelB/DinJ family antitoxin [Patescibacteria group bacterium]